MGERLKRWLVFGILLGTAAYGIAEEITVSTFYPSPRGVYNELRTVGSAALATQPGTGVAIGKDAPDAGIRLDVAGTLQASGLTCPDCVGPAALQANAVTPGKIAPDAVGSAQVVTDSLTAGDLAASAVGTSELQAQAVTMGKIAVGAVSSLRIANGTIQDIDVAEGTLTARVLAPNAVGVSELQPNAVNPSKLAPNAVVAGKIAPNAVGSGEIRADAVENEELMNGGTWALTSPLTITGARVNIPNLGTNSVSVVNGGAISVASNLTTLNTISATDFSCNNCLGAGDIGADAIGQSELANGAVNGAKISANAVGPAHIATGAVGSGHIAANAVGPTQLASSGVSAGTYGSSTQVPRITVDSDGRITWATTSPISSSSPSLEFRPTCVGGDTVCDLGTQYDACFLVGMSILDSKDHNGVEKCWIWRVGAAGMWQVRAFSHHGNDTKCRVACLTW